jgi:hypothetical protein
VKGPEGNIEYLCYMVKRNADQGVDDSEAECISIKETVMTSFANLA